MSEPKTTRRLNILQSIAQDMTKIPFTKHKGRPVNPYRAAERIIGTSGVLALSEADLYIVDGDTIRKLAGIVKEKAEAAT